MDDYEEPDFYDYGNKTTYISIGAQRKLFKKLYGGISYSYAHYDTNYENNIQPTSTTETNGIQFSLLNDTRDAIYYPTKGSKARLRWSTFPEWFGNAEEANKVQAEYNKYFQCETIKM